MSPESVTLGIALIAGIVSFISPCVLPLVPAYIGYMGGRMTNTVAAQLSGGQVALRPSLSARFTIFLHGLSFVGGFTFVFVALGLLSTAFVQQIGGGNIALVTNMIGRIGGLVIIFFGLHFMGLLRRLFDRLTARPATLDNLFITPLLAVIGTALILWGFTGALVPPLRETVFTADGTQTSVLHWPTLLALTALVVYLLTLALGGAFTRPGAFWKSVIERIQTALYTDTRRQMTASGREGFASSAIMGVVFSAGWTPCIGPVYGAVLTLAANTGDVARAAPLLAAYSLGLGIPFLLTALLLDSAQGILRSLQRHVGKIELASGVLLIIVGLLVATGTLQTLSQNLSGEFADFSYSLEESVIGSLTGGIQDSPAPADDGAQSDESGAALNTITGAASAAPTIGTDLGSLAPDFTTTREDGQPIKLSDLRGQVVLLNFWATWCGPCRVEMPEFQAAYAKYASQGFTVLAVNNMETADQIRDFRDAMKLTFPMALDERGSIADLYNLKGFPGTYIIDRSGIIVARFLGVMTREQIEQAVGAALSA